MRSHIKFYCFLVLVFAFGAKPAVAQPVTAANDGTGTVITNNSPNLYSIDGGTQAGGNLFHSFEQFGVGSGQTVNFLSTPNIDNILGRVIGGDASVINGLLQVTGGQSSLFLINPAGMVFGPGAQLNVPADFTATTASDIQIGDAWFSALGSNNYETLVGTPHSFAFANDTPGAILNAGELSVDSGQSVRLIGGTVINTGTLSAPGGDITIQAVPESGLVTITQDGNLLNLGLPVDTQTAIGGDALTPETLPQLLSNSQLDHATGVTVEDGVVRLSQTNTVIPTDTGVTIAAGSLDASSSGGVGGDIDVLGERVGAVSATVDASGALGGGSVGIGGGYQGNGPIPNAQQTYISGDSTIQADAITTGDGGQVIVWADGDTDFYGSISARGGENSGNGGFVEVSGKENLAFRGEADVDAENGNAGTLLLDPRNITIVSDASGNDDDEFNAPLDGQILVDQGPEQDFTISEQTLETFGLNNPGSTILLQATEDIEIRSLADNELTFALNSVDELIITAGSRITFDAGRDFTMGLDQSITATGRILTIRAGNDIRVGNINTSNIAADRFLATDINDEDVANADFDDGSIALIAEQGNITVNSLTAGAGDASRGFVDLNLNSRNFNRGDSLDVDRTISLYIESSGTFRALGFIQTDGISDDSDFTFLELSPDSQDDIAQTLDVEKSILENSEDLFQIVEDLPENFPVSLLAVPPGSPDSEDYPAIRIIHGGGQSFDASNLISIEGTGNEGIEDFAIGPIAQDDGLAFIDSFSDEIPIPDNISELLENDEEDEFFFSRRFIDPIEGEIIEEDEAIEAIPTPDENFLDSLDVDLSIVVGGIVIVREAANRDPGGISQPVIPNVSRIREGTPINGETVVTDSPGTGPQDFENEAQDVLLALQAEQCSLEGNVIDSIITTVEGLSCISAQAQAVTHATEVDVTEEGIIMLMQPASE